MRLNLAERWRILVQGQMSSRFVAVAKAAFENAPQMPSIYDDGVVQTFAANGPVNSLHKTILPRASRRSANLLDAHSLNSRCEAVPIDSIAISNQIPWRPVVRKRFNNLLCSPYRSRVFSDIEVQDSTTVVCKNQEDIQHA